MKRILYTFLLMVISAGILGAGGLVGLYIWASQDLPSITKVQDYRPMQVTTVYGRDNTILGYFFKEKRFLLNLEGMPPHLLNAFFAAEDTDFFKHQGISPKAIIRAAITNLISGEKSGASTITQQVVKRLLLTPEKSYERKLKEAILAYRLERYLDKDQILYIYLNQIYLGSSAYGVEAAARTYFAKHASELTIAESAIIAALPKTPTAINPYANPTATIERQRWILQRMYSSGFLTHEEYEAAKEEKLHFTPMPDPSWKIGAWYLEEVRRQLINFFKEENITRLGIQMDLYGEQAVYEAGLHIYTAMDPVHQLAAEMALRDGLLVSSKRSGWHGPIKNLKGDEVEQFLATQNFKPENLANAQWDQAVVTGVKKDGAEVRIGAYKGSIALSAMQWARHPNLRQIPEYARISDSTKALKPGDLVWVSAYGANGTANPVGAPAFVSTDSKKNIPAYNPGTVTPEIPIKLCLEQRPEIQGAVASIDIQSGDLVALVGGYAFSPSSQFNRATQARRQPGSAFKPFVYSAALDSGFTAASIVNDAPFELYDVHAKKLWKPGNYDGKYLGYMPVRTALAKSRNVTTVRVAQTIGIGKVVTRAHELGIQGNIPKVLAISLGSAETTPIEMAEAYTAFADKGRYTKPRLITSIANCWNEKLVDFTPDVRQAITPGNAYVMATMLKQVITAGTGARANVLGRPIAGKTGTSNEERDGWFIGFSPYLVTSVYIGYDNFAPMGRAETGGKSALPIFVEYRKKVEALYPLDDFTMPDDVVIVTVDNNTGNLPGTDSSSTSPIPFIKGTEPLFVSGTPIDQNKPADVQTGEDIMRQLF